MSATISNVGLSQAQLVEFLSETLTLCNELKADLNAITTKLDADAGVTDTDYVALHTVAAADLSLTTSAD